MIRLKPLLRHTPDITTMKRLKTLLVLSTAAMLAAATPVRAAGQTSATDAKALALLGEMTLDEKIGQMTQVDMLAMKDKQDIARLAIGSMLSGGDSAPADNRPRTWAAAYDGYQAWALKSRLKVPLIYGIDAVHGQNHIDGAVIFPHNIGLGATRDPALVEKAQRATAEEVSATGISWTFAPCIACRAGHPLGPHLREFWRVARTGRKHGRGKRSRPPGGRPCRADLRARLRQALPRRRRHFRRQGPGQHPMRRGRAAADPLAGLQGRHQGRGRFDHGLLQQFQRPEDARQPAPSDRVAQRRARFPGVPCLRLGRHRPVVARLQG